MKRVFLLIICTAILTSHLSAQYYSRGQAPSGINWKQIKTDNFQIIFPETYKEEANYVANVFEYIYDIGAKSLDHKPKKISVIIHNETVASNGFVVWAPSRVELFTTPPQNNDTHDWMERLIVHEYRHVVQVDKLNQGITRVLGWLFGEQATGAVLGLFVPMWFLEGDAVVMETALTNSGRGRLPRFEQGLRAQIIEKEKYSFDKAVFGSYNDYVPSYYELGYLLVSSFRLEHGANAWEPVLNNVARRPYTLSPFTLGMRRFAGINRAEHYYNTMAFLDSAWTKQKEKTVLTPAKHIETKNKLYASYNNVFFTDNRNLIAVKTGLKDILRFVKINIDGSEEVLFTPGNYMLHSLNYNAGKAVWSEYKRDPRWEHRSWSEIHTYNIATGEHKKLSSKTKWFSPDLSRDGKYIAVVEATESIQNSLVIISSETGEEIKRFQTNNNDFLITPSWNSAGNEIVVVALDSRGKRIDILNLDKGIFETIIHPTHTEISRPEFWGTHLFFNAAYSGIDNIYYFDRRNNIINKIISSKYGAIDASLSPSGMKFVFSDYTSDGYKISLVDITDIEEKELDYVENHSVNFATKLAKQEKGLVFPDSVKQNYYEIKNYSKLANLFRLHSWGPVVVDVTNKNIKPGASLMFQNNLSTSFLHTGYEHNINEGLGKFFVDYSYHGFYPVISANYGIGRRKAFLLNSSLLYTEQSASGGISLPLSYNHRHIHYGFRPSLSVSQYKFSPDTDTIFSGDGSRYSVFEKQTMSAVSYRWFAYILRSSVKRDMNPRFGQTLDFFYSHNPFEGHGLGSLIGFRGITYLPGLARHHSLKVTAGYQLRESGNGVYGYSDFLNYPRGVFYERHEELKTLFFDYAFPVIYPDFSLPGIIYIQRVSINTFFDFAQAWSEENASNDENSEFESIRSEFLTCGIDLLFDINALRFFAPVNIGPRISYDINEERFFFNLLFNIEF